MECNYYDGDGKKLVTMRRVLGIIQHATKVYDNNKGLALFFAPAEDGEMQYRCFIGLQPEINFAVLLFNNRSSEPDCFSHTHIISILASVEITVPTYAQTETSFWSWLEEHISELQVPKQKIAVYA